MSRWIQTPVKMCLPCACTGMDRVGFIGIWAQLGCLAVAVVPTFLPIAWAWHAGVWHARLLLAGVVLSRWGLWTFDLAITQMLQERVASSQLGALTCSLLVKELLSSDWKGCMPQPCTSSCLVQWLAMAIANRKKLIDKRGLMNDGTMKCLK